MIRKSRAGGLLTLALIAASGGAIGEDASTVAIVPVQKAPFHIPVFSNEFVTLLNVTIPAGRNAPYHSHSRDLATVLVEAADTRVQVLGQAPADRPARQAGVINFTAYSKSPGVHQVTNTDSKPYHIVGFEIAYPEPGRFTSSSRSSAPEYKQELDNERVRGWRLILEPGQTAAEITQTAPGARIIVRGGELTETEPGQSGRAMRLEVAGFMWQSANVTRALKNTGNTPLEIVEFELK